jgi:pimeloyl-ACP methyl ester carboxylesterase
MKMFLRAVGAALTLVVIALVWLSWPTYTPPITDANGVALPNSISEEERLTINGLEQWTLTRGADRDAPILLVLHGGPGAGEFAWFRAYDSALEDHFVVVHWDQRGAGKSFDSATPPETMNLEQYILDIDALIDHLRSKFGRERIAVLGHSWGSLLGTIYVSRHPEKVSAYIGTGQISDMRRNEEVSYGFALAEARRLDNNDAIADLEAIGAPPYGVDETIVQRGWLDVFGGGLTHEPRSMASLAWTAMSVPEFNLLDLIALARSALFSMDHLWTEISDVNLDETYLEFDVPVFFILGRYDQQTPSSLAEPYFNRLQAPDKELFYFEHSAHAPPWEEPDRFVDVMAMEIKPRLMPDNQP